MPPSPLSPLRVHPPLSLNSVPERGITDSDTSSIHVQGDVPPPPHPPLPLPPPSGTQYGITPLIWASLKGHLEVVKTLVASGADVNAKTNVSDGGR